MTRKQRRRSVSRRVLAGTQKYFEQYHGIVLTFVLTEKWSNAKEQSHQVEDTSGEGHPKGGPDKDPI
jgi:hypothetical protein